MRKVKLFTVLVLAVGALFVGCGDSEGKLFSKKVTTQYDATIDEFFYVVQNTVVSFW